PLGRAAAPPGAPDRPQAACLGADREGRADHGALAAELPAGRELTGLPHPDVEQKSPVEKERCQIGKLFYAQLREDESARGRPQQPEPTRGQRYPDPGRSVGGKLDDTPRPLEELGDDSGLAAFPRRVLDYVDRILARGDGTIADNEDLRALRAEAEQFTGTTTEQRRSKRTAAQLL